MRVSFRFAQDEEDAGDIATLVSREGADYIRLRVIPDAEHDALPNNTHHVINNHNNHPPSFILCQ